MRSDNLFADLPTSLPDEFVTLLAGNRQVRIERIVSTGHNSPPDFWYDQPEQEWVIVLRGAARLLFEKGEPLDLLAGDHILIPASQRHRVEWTTPDEPTVWLAVFFTDDDRAADSRSELRGGLAEGAPPR